MSISNSLSNALSGLTAASRAAEVVASNVANAATDGYGRRVVETTSATVGGRGAGVEIVGIRREVDQYVLADRRLADAALGNQQAITAFYADLEALVGTPDLGSSIPGRVAAFEASLLAAASRPDSDARLNAVVDAANGLANSIVAASDGVQQQRMAAEQTIAAQVDVLNNNLQQITDLNTEIQRQVASGQDGAALMDQRQVLIDQVAAIIPVRVVQMDQGQVAVFSTGGAALVNGGASQFGFVPTGQITAGMSAAAGDFGDLTLNGQTIDMSNPANALQGGSLSAQFDIRDRLAPQAQAELDALARDLIERFEDPALDPTRAPGDPGLFTDAGGVFDPAAQVGVAGRLQVNPIVDPAQDGQVWHLRSGFGATAPGPAGDARLLNEFVGVLNTAQTAASGSFSSVARTFDELAAELSADVSQNLYSAQTEQGFAAARQEALRMTELSGGVDIDQEMQMLLRIEQAYAANAKVVQTIDDLITALLRI